MKHWTDDERVEYETAADDAWRAGVNSAERADAWVAILRDAEQAHKQWAIDVLADALREGAWKRLKSERHAQVRHNVAFAGQVASISAIGGAVRTTAQGVQHEQLEFLDMTKGQLLRKRDDLDAVGFATRRSKHRVNRLIDLFDGAPTATTAREAAAMQRVDIDAYLESGAA